MSPAFKINDSQFDLLANILQFRHFFDASQKKKDISVYHNMALFKQLTVNPLFHVSFENILQKEEITHSVLPQNPSRRTRLFLLFSFFISCHHYLFVTLVSLLTPAWVAQW